MKVALYGNTCNNFYTLAKALREKLNIDAHLYLHNKVDFQNLPESDNPELLNNYPDWIHKSSKWNPYNFLKSHDKTFIRELNKYDVVFLSDLGVSMIPFLKGKTYFYVTGSDLTQVPFPKKFAWKFKKITDKVIWTYIGLMQRRGIKNATKILSQPFPFFANPLKELKVSPERISTCYFPILMDTDIIKLRENARELIDSYNRELLEPYNFIIFHPSRLMMTPRKEHVASGHWKNNDVLFKAFAIFQKKYNITDACIAMPDRVHSPDMGIAKKLISELGMQGNIVWLKPTTSAGFPRKELVNFYSLSDVVIDEFGSGGFGSIVVEGMACEKPTFCYINEEVMKQLYPWHPIIPSKEPEQIADLFSEYYFNKDLAREKGKISRAWVKEYHSIENGINIYLKNFKKEFHDFI